MSPRTGAGLRNLEGEPAYDVRWPWQQPLRPGVTAVLRVRNESVSLPWVLPRLLEACAEVVLVDNGSDDGTADVARELAAGAGAADRLQVHPYPYVLSRCGPEHLDTSPRSLHSLTYFNNFAFSHVRTTTAMKWDGDMALTERGVAFLRDLAWQLEAEPSMVAVPLQPLYVVDERTAYIDPVPYREPNLHPNAPAFTFTKAFEWELKRSDPAVPTWGLHEAMCVELKWVDADEFSHWSSTDFDNQRTGRKKREWDAMADIAQGRTPPDFLRVEAPPGVHVVDHVVDDALGRLQAERRLQPARPGGAAANRPR